MITPNPKRTEYVLDLLVKENYNFVWVCEISTFQYELHTNESVTPLDMPESGDGLKLLKYIRRTFVDPKDAKKFTKLFSPRKIFSNLRKHGEYIVNFPFTVGLSSIKINYSEDSKDVIYVCSKYLEEEVAIEFDNAHEALLVVELDARKHFSIKNVSENIPKILNVSLLRYTKNLRYDVFAGYHPEDRLKIEQLFLANAKDGREFFGDFRVGVNPGFYQRIHIDVTVKKYRRSYIYYVTVKKNDSQNSSDRKIYEFEDNPRKKIHSFDIDLITSSAHLGMETRRYYNQKALITPFPDLFVEQGLIYYEDAEKFRNAIDSIKNGSPFEEVDVRVKNSQTNTYVWRNVTLNTIFDDKDIPVRALGISEDISFYKEQEARFHDVLEMCGFTTWDYDVDEKKFSNAGRLKKLFGLSSQHLENVPENLIGSGVIHREDIEAIRNIHRKLSEGTLSAECEFRARNINGGNFNWYKLRYTIVNDKNGNPQYAVGSTTDINEQKVAELSYEYEAKTLYEMQGDTLIEKACINATRDEVKSFATKGEGEVSFNNQSFSEVIKRMMPYCVNEDTARLLWNKLNPGNLVNSFSQGNKTFSFVHRRQVRNANLQWVSSKVNMYQDPKTGDIIGFIYTYDINRKKLSQEALELIGTSDFDLVGIIDVIGGGAIILHDNDIMSRVPNWDCGDYDGYFEQFADRMHEYLDSEEDYIALHDKIKIASLVKELSVSPSYEIIVKHHKDPSGETLVLRTTFRYLDQEQSSIILCMSDITSALAEEREREKVLKEALDQANIASRAKTDFLAQMSHDIRTPLNGIMGMTQLAMEENDPVVIHEYLEKIDTSSHFLLGLLNDILDMSRIEKGVINLEQETYSLSEFKASLDSIILPLCKNKDIHLNIQISEDQSFITDKQKFNQIFFNLLSNSVKFTEVGGVIDVVVENSKIENKNFEADFIVRDYGCGMTEEFQKKMFEAFSQERNNMTNMNQGSGLGLAIVKNLVEKMGGTIEVWSSTAEENHGTRIVVHMVLPISDEK